MGPDVQAIRDMVLQHWRSSGYADTMEDAEVLATQICTKLRLVYWHQKDEQIAQLVGQVDALERELAMKSGGLAAGGLCPHCHNAL